MTAARSDYRAFLDYLDRIEADSIGKPAVESDTKPQSRIVAERIIAEMQHPIITEDTPDLRLEAGYDQQGRWHRPENRQRGTGVVRAVSLSMLFWIPALIWAIAHYAQK
jgi:hypothetical protein